MKEYAIDVVAEAEAKIFVFANSEAEAVSKATRELDRLYPSNFRIKDIELDLKSLEEVCDNE